MYNSTYKWALTGLINQLVLGWACGGFLLAAGGAAGAGPRVEAGGGCVKCSDERRGAVFCLNFAFRDFAAIFA
jgi:hypothetical protein